jgi:hypothetical protein
LVLTLFRLTFHLALPQPPPQIGTFSGIFVSLSTANTVWRRLGTKAEFPIVYVMQMRWYPTTAFGTDLLVVSTMGRSVYSMLSATAIVAEFSVDCACPAYKTLTAPSAASRANAFQYAPIVSGFTRCPSAGPSVIPPTAGMSTVLIAAIAAVGLVLLLAGAWYCHRRVRSRAEAHEETMTQILLGHSVNIVGGRDIAPAALVSAAPLGSAPLGSALPNEHPATGSAALKDGFQTLN